MIIGFVSSQSSQVWHAASDLPTAMPHEQSSQDSYVYAFVYTSCKQNTLMTPLTLSLPDFSIVLQKCEKT